MTVKVLPFRADHIKTLTPQPEQAAEITALRDEQVRAVEMSGPGWTILVNDKAVACATISDLRDGRGFMWAAIGADAGPYLLRATRIGVRMMNESPYKRIEAIVKYGFAAGEKWARLLGFELETPFGMRNFGVDGSTYMLFARVQ